MYDLDLRLSCQLVGIQNAFIKLIPAETDTDPAQEIERRDAATTDHQNATLGIGLGIDQFVRNLGAVFPGNI